MIFLCFWEFAGDTSYKDENDKRKTKWIPTGYPVKGNKKKAQEFLNEQRMNFEIPAAEEPRDDADISFVDYLAKWLQIARSTIAITTYSNYSGLIDSAIDPWFRKTSVTLKELKRETYSRFLFGHAR